MPINCPASGSGSPLPSGVAESCMVDMVRVFVGDYDGTTYTSDRLLQVLGTAQFLVDQETSSCTQICRPDNCLCSDGFDLDPCLYPGFANLVALKAACILDRGVARERAGASQVSAKCGPASMTLKTTDGALDALLSKGNCKAYEDLWEELCSGYNAGILDACGQVVSIFTSGTYHTDGWRPNSCGSGPGSSC